MVVWSMGGYTTVFVLFVTVLILLYLVSCDNRVQNFWLTSYLDWKYKYWQRMGIKSPTFIESMKNIPKSYKQPLHEAIITAYNKHGRFFGMPGLFPQLWIAEPDLIKQILVKDFHIFRNRTKINFGDPVFQKMLSIACDDDWKRIRCIMSPTFSSSKMRKMAILVKECADNTTKYFQKLAEKDEEFDIKRHFGSYAVDVIANTAFATKINSLDNPDNEFIANARNLTNRDVSIFAALTVLLAPRLAKWLKIEMFPSKPLKYYKEIVLNILKERETSKMKGHDFLQLMMDAKDGYIENFAEDLKEDKEAGEVYHVENLPKHKTMSIEEIVSNCVLFFTGGQDTTAGTLAFIAYYLALNPDCQEKLLKEVQETWEKHGALDFDIVSKMPYLDAVICESLRMSSAAALLMRLSSEECVLGDTGITIPKETNIIVPIHAMHYDPEWFPNPENFDPDRFLPENKHLIKPFTYLPFGDGPRNCIGMRYVTMVMKLCLSYLLMHIKFVATEETKKPLEYYFGQGTLQVKRLPLKVEKR